MRQIVLTPAGKTVAKTAIFTSLIAFVIGILTIMLMDDHNLSFVTAVLAAAGIVVAATVALLISIFLVCWAAVVCKERYDAWYRRVGFRKDLAKLNSKSKKTTKKTTKRSTSKKKSAK